MRPARLLGRDLQQRSDLRAQRREFALDDVAYERQVDAEVFVEGGSPSKSGRPVSLLRRASGARAAPGTRRCRLVAHHAA